MASLATSGIGAKFRRKNTSYYEDIAEVMKISGPDLKRDTIDVTSLDSIGGYKEFIFGLRDGGSIKLDMIYRRDTYEIMKGDFESDVLIDYEILFPGVDKMTAAFQANVSDMGLEIPVDKQISCSVTLKISGQVTINSDSGS